MGEKKKNVKETGGVGRMGQVSLLNTVVKSGFTKKETLEPRLEKSEGVTPDTSG